MKVFPLSVPTRSKQMTEGKTGQTESQSSPNQIPVLTFEIYTLINGCLLKNGV